MHKLLERQLKRVFAGAVPPGLEVFLAAVDAAYVASDEERAMLERSLELMSAELSERNEQLRQDIATLRRTEEELRMREEEFRDLIERVPQVIMVRRDDRFIFANQAGLEALGYASCEELAAVAALELVYADDRALADSRMKTMDEEGSFPGAAEIRFLRKDGETAILEISLGRVILFEGKRAMLLAAQDVTDRKKMHARLQLADRMASVGTLAAGVAHEINNPLAYVLANISYVAERLDQLVPPSARAVDDDLWQALDEALEGANRVRAIVQDMKIFSRSDEERNGPVDLTKVLDSAIGIATNEIRHRARLVRKYEPVPLIAGNGGRLGQVFVNLLVNAAQAISEGAAERNEIFVGLARERDRVTVTVRDTGSGMLPEVQKRIFDPFFTTKPIGEGSGLGLAICHGIVAAHGGEIELESAPGRGTTFTLRFPVAETEAVDDSRRCMASVRTRSRRVLVVDDEPLVGKSVRRTLRDHQVEVVANGAEAIRRLQTGERFEIILCDLMMPEMTGMDLHSLVSREWPELAERMIFLTGGAFTARARAFLDQVPNRKVYKPFDAQELRALVAEPIGG